MQDTGIEIKNLSFGYTKERLFSNLDLTLESGNIYGLLGKNGAGKTSLLKLICGLRFPEAGSCSVLGWEPQDRPAALLEDIYFIPEEFYAPAISEGARSSPSSPTGRRRSSFWPSDWPPDAGCFYSTNRQTAWTSRQKASFANSWPGPEKRTGSS